MQCKFVITDYYRGAFITIDNTFVTNYFATTFAKLFISMTAIVRTDAFEV